MTACCSGVAVHATDQNDFDRVNVCSLTVLIWHWPCELSYPDPVKITEMLAR
jgi:hypothetical protein